MRGAVSGAFWGLVLGGGGLAVASLMTEQPSPANAPQVPQITTPQTVEYVSTPGRLAQNPSDALSETALDAPQMIPPAAPTAEMQVDSAPMAPPVVVRDEPPQPSPAADPPENEGTAVIASEDRAAVAAPAPPELADATMAGIEPPVADVDPAPVPQRAAETTAPVIAMPAQDAASPVVTPPVNDAPRPTVVSEPPATIAQAPVSVADTETQPVVPSDSRNDALHVEQTAPAPQVTAETSPPTTILPQVNSGVRVNRPGAAAAPVAGTPSETTQPEDVAPDAPALLRYAATFENPGDLPMLGVILLDDGTMPDAVARLADLPFPVTVILDPQQGQVGRKMTAYRDAGVEVGLQIALPVGARAQDVEIAFQAAFAMVPESVVLFSGSADLLQGDRAVTGQVIAVLAAEGLGLVVVERGLNSVARLADAAGVPAAAVLRDLDVGSASRALDQAAFRARQGQGEDVVVTGRLTPDILGQLADWARGAGVGQVALAPVSALLAPR